IATVSVLWAPRFGFHNCSWNAVLEAESVKKGFQIPMARKTGTTIAKVVYKDGIILGADTRATEGMVVADKNCSKIHLIAPNIYCCGARTAADMTTQPNSSNLELHSLSTGQLPRMVTVNQMLKQTAFRYQGYIGASLVLGGVDVSWPHLYSIYPHRSTDKLPYVTLGSGSLAVMAEHAGEKWFKQFCKFLDGTGSLLTPGVKPVTWVMGPEDKLDWVCSSFINLFVIGQMTALEISSDGSSNRRPSEE
uniref:Proteasome subunit beta n=1 Tax=Sphenodon punctatus TaxID=8508 RepID=A0A8D0G6E5_SPHPU